MNRKGRVKPSKSTSIAAMVMGTLFVILGVVKFIPMMGLFGIIWTLGALTITILHGINVFTEKGTAYYQIDIEEGKDSKESELNFDEKLHKLERLKEEGLINQDEYDLKRTEILNQKW